MLTVKSLSIAYSNRVIFENVNIQFKRGTITVIQGKSGSGKSSFLNVLGLMQTASNYEYTFDNTVVSNFNDAERADFRLYNVGFVFQQSNLIQELTAKENLLVPMSITNQGNNINSKADELLGYVGLEEFKNSYPGSLSGGEEQRLAIARAIANDADIILADEPTASLDAENSRIILELFSKLAHELNKIVILVSHSEFVPKYADVICEIKNKDLVITKTATGTASEIKNTATAQEKPSLKRNVLRFIRYYTGKRHGDKVLNRVFVAVTALVAAAAILSTTFGANFAEGQQNLLNDAADRSILIVNNTLNLSGKTGQVDYEEALVIAPDVIKQVESIPNISKVYPWYSFFSDGIDLDRQTSLANIKIIDRTTIIVEKSYGNSFAGGLLSPRDKFTVCPLYEEEFAGISNILDHQSKSDAQTGLILTKSLADKLSNNPSELIDKTIEITCFVPTKVSDSTAINWKGETEEVTLVFYKLATIRSTITGIMSDSYSPWNYSKTEESDIVLMNYNQLIDVVNQNKDLNLEENQKELGPSALVIFANSYTDIPDVASKFEDISASFNVVHHATNTRDIIESNANTKSVLLVATTVFIVIIAVLFSILYYLKNRARKMEFGILKAIGLTKSNIMALTSVEMLKLSLPAFVISIVFSIILMVLGNNSSLFTTSISTSPFSITLYSVLVGFLVCVVLVVLSGIFSVYNTSRVEPIDAIRKINR